LLIRHLVMPGCLDETKAILEWIASTLGSDTYVNLMDQYSPAGKVSESAYVDINRPLTSAEFLEARRIASDLGLQRLDVRRPHPRLKRWMMLVQD
jgi:putative pyruvate formate lyase activating enzyme